jgi:hypothetical protein
VHAMKRLALTCPAAVLVVSAAMANATIERVASARSNLVVTPRSVVSQGGGQPLVLSPATPLRTAYTNRLQLRGIGGRGQGGRSSGPSTASAR